MTHELAANILHCIGHCRAEDRGWGEAPGFDYSLVLDFVKCEHTAWLIYSLDPTDELRECCALFLEGKDMPK